MRSEVPAPDGRSARPVWQALAFLGIYICLGLCIVAVTRSVLM